MQAFVEGANEVSVEQQAAVVGGAGGDDVEGKVSVDGVAALATRQLQLFVQVIFSLTVELSQGLITD